MKNVKKIITLAAIALVAGIGLFPSTSDAAWTPWKSPGTGTGCKVRVWTDANTYTKNATTIDYKAEQNGKCGKLYYRASVNVANQYPFARISPNQFGYFSNSTPIKKIKLSSLTKTGLKADMKVELYTDAKRQYTLTWVDRTIQINKR